MSELKGSPLDVQRNVLFELGKYVVWVNSSNRLFEERGDLVGGRVHTHALFDVHCPVDGTYKIVTEKKKIDVSPGFLTIIAPGVFHNTEIASDTTVPVKRVGLKLSFIRKNEQEAALLPDNNHDDCIVSAFFGIDYSITLADDFDCIKILRAVRRQFEEQPLGYYQNIQGQLLCLITEIARKLHQTQHMPSALCDSRQEQIEVFFNSNVGADASQDALAQELFISTRQLNRLLLDIYGMGFKEKLVYTRIAVAKNWLSCSDKSIAEISEICGYGFESSLNHTFKRITGMTPQEYRKSSNAHLM